MKSCPTGCKARAAHIGSHHHTTQHFYFQCFAFKNSFPQTLTGNNPLDHDRATSNNRLPAAGKRLFSDDESGLVDVAIFSPFGGFSGGSTVCISDRNQLAED
jgi:hypothetical protein